MESTGNMESNADPESEEIKVFWGPLTLDEIQIGLSLKRSPKVIGSRSSICTDQPSRTIYSNSLTRDCLFKEGIFNTTEPGLEVSFLSEYYTPSETVTNEKSGMSHTPFLTPREGSQTDNNNIEKVSKVSHSCTSASATECSNLMCYEEKCPPTASFKFDEAGHSDTSQKSDDIIELKASPNDVNKTFDKTQHLNCEIDTILVPSDDDDDIQDTARLSIILEESVVEDEIDNCSSSEIYVISSDENSSFEMQLEIKEKIQKERKDESQQTLNSASFRINSSPLESSKLCKFNEFNTRNINKRRSRQKSGHINEDCSEMVKITEPTKDIIEEQLHETSNVTVDITETYVDNSVLDGYNADGAAKIIITNHDEASDELNDSSTSSEFRFNDTLEEMELALKHGLDYAIAEELDNSVSPEPGTSCLQSDKINGKHSSVTSVHPQSANTSLLKMPTKNLCSNSELQKNSPSKVQVEKHFGFKTPLKPLSVPKNKTPDFKHVVSPVSLYIKNAPRVPKVQKIAAKRLVAESLVPKPTIIKTSNKENVDLPNRIYKPAKVTVTSKEKELKLPRNIEKHLPVIPDIVKHTRRVNKPANVFSVEEELLSENLTVCYSNADGMNVSETVCDISLLTTKKAHIT